MSNILVARGGGTRFAVDTSNPRHPTYRQLALRDSKGVSYTSGNADGVNNEADVRDL